MHAVPIPFQCRKSEATCPTQMHRLEVHGEGVAAAHPLLSHLHLEGPSTGGGGNVLEVCFDFGG